MYKLVFYVPEDHAEIVKSAVFESGAGRVGHYEKCCWQVSGIGQFMPQQGSDPFVGNEGELETVQESRVEMVCEDGLIKKAVVALKRAHPYEEPAYDVWCLSSMDSLP